MFGFQLHNCQDVSQTLLFCNLNGNLPSNIPSLSLSWHFTSFIFTCWFLFNRRDRFLSILILIFDRPSQKVTQYRNDASHAAAFFVFNLGTYPTQLLPLINGFTIVFGSLLYRWRFFRMFFFNFSRDLLFWKSIGFEAPSCSKKEKYFFCKFSFGERLKE